MAAILKGNNPVPENVSTGLLQEALMKVADSQWRKNKSYADYFRDMNSERRDYQMLNVWELKKDAMIPTVLLPYVSKDNKWLSRAVDSLQEIQAPGFDLISEQGYLEIRNSKTK
jgi:hypothetical protein